MFYQCIVIASVLATDRIARVQNIFEVMRVDHVIGPG